MKMDSGSVAVFLCCLRDDSGKFPSSAFCWLHTGHMLWFLRHSVRLLQGLGHSCVSSLVSLCVFSVCMVPSQWGVSWFGSRQERRRPLPFHGCHKMCGYPRDCAWVRVLGTSGLAGAKARLFASTCVCVFLRSLIVCFSVCCIKFICCFYSSVGRKCGAFGLGSRRLPCRWFGVSHLCPAFVSACVGCLLFVPVLSSDLTRVSHSSPSCNCVHSVRRHPSPLPPLPSSLPPTHTPLPPPPPQPFWLKSCCRHGLRSRSQGNHLQDTLIHFKCARC